ncbi:MAG: hypothetical protein HYU74_06050 [Dechloromonas sp.]|nr:hypothetical protein [Dechloromonas sp.]
MPRCAVRQVGCCVYGTELLADLAARLKADFGSGYGVDNLELFRRFYLEYPRLLPAQISDAVRRKSLLDSSAAENSDAARRNFDALPMAFQMQLPGPDAPMTPGQLSPCLSWTHYRVEPADKSNMAKYLFGGFQKCLYPVQKFDSDSERKLAVILEREASKWFKPAKGQFQIYY